MCVYFNCNQPGHYKVGCPLQNLISAIKNPTLTTLRIIDGCQGRAVAPTAKGRAFQLMAEVAIEAPDVVASTFLVNSMHVVVLFDSGASHSFVS